MREEVLTTPSNRGYSSLGILHRTNPLQGPRSSWDSAPPHRLTSGASGLVGGHSPLYRAKITPKVEKKQTTP